MPVGFSPHAHTHAPMHMHTCIPRKTSEGVELPAPKHTGGPSDCKVHALPVLPLWGRWHGVLLSSKAVGIRVGLQGQVELGEDNVQGRCSEQTQPKTACWKLRLSGEEMGK